jgi:thiamine-monophosphate kinase
VPNKTRRIGEFELIARYFAPLARDAAGALDLKDDAAWIEGSADAQWVVTSDALVEGVHFLPDDPAALIARKALRVNLSDLAAKGAVAKVYLLDVVLTEAHDEAWIGAFAGGLAKDQDEFGVRLIGGDTTSTPGPLTIAVTALGQVPRGRMLLRSGAQADDEIYVSGTIGDAALGLLVLRGGLNRLGNAARADLAERYRVPEPRTTLGPRLIGHANAAMDVSDGLVADLGHICSTSGLGAVIEEDLVPLSPAAAAAVREHPALITAVLTGGDDYEILFTAPSAMAPDIAKVAQALNVPLARIGRMRQDAGVVVLKADGSAREIEKAGWQHF